MGDETAHDGPATEPGPGVYPLDHPGLARLIWRETFAQALSLMNRGEVAVATLRLEALSDSQIAALLGISRQAVTRRLRRASRRIAGELPEMGSFLAGRVPTAAEAGEEDMAPIPLEQGWLCSHPPALARLPGPTRYLSAEEVAGRWRVQRRTVQAWCRAGKFAGAVKRGRRWWIPEEHAGVG